jgi:hypothetical protein
MDNNEKLYNYGDIRGKALRCAAGNEQAAIATAEGFIWDGSTYTHDRFVNRKFKVARYVNKDTKRFYEQRL